MKRFHIHVAVKNFDRSIAFYSALFASEPTVKENDYAKWMLEDPRINFAITPRGFKKGIDHIGLQAESDEELAEIRERLVRADRPILDQPDVTCCYAQSKKTWIKDPDGIAWETFVTHGQSIKYSDGTVTEKARTALEAAGCCLSNKAEEQSNNQCC